jgi:hypothetical protein
MELSTTADWLGVIGGVALGSSWLWKLWRWLHAEVAWANEGAIAGGELVAELLDQAISPARRADIHAYIQFRCTEIEAGRTRRLMCSSAMGAFVLAIGLFFLLSWRVLDVELISWLWWLSITNYVVLVIAFSLSLFFNAQLRRVEEGWQRSARNALGERAFRYAPKT